MTAHLARRMRRLALGALAGPAAVAVAVASDSAWPAAKIGAEAVWAAATDPVARTRYLPMQLVVPGIWDGTQQIDYPAADGHDAEGTVWSGPQPWRNPYSGAALTVYDRRRNTRREGEVEQKMAVRADGAAIGRVYDSRFGRIVCDQEGKFPLGRWQQDEVRSFDYQCLTTRRGQVVTLYRTARITIEALDYEYRGIAHSVRFAWQLSDAKSGAVLDHRTYILSPGRGLVAHDRR